MAVQSINLKKLLNSKAGLTWIEKRLPDENGLIMVDHLIEIIFKDISVNEIGNLLKNLTCGGLELVDYNLTCDVLEVKWNSAQSIEKIFKKNKEFGLFLNLNKLNTSDVFCRNVEYLFINTKIKLI